MGKVGDAVKILLDIDQVLNADELSSGSTAAGETAETREELAVAAVG